MTNDAIETNNNPLTMESFMTVIKEIIAETNASIKANLAETNARMAESSARTEANFAETSARMAEWSARFEKSQAESSARFDQEMKKLIEAQNRTDKTIGGMGNNNGALAEEFFFNAIFYGSKTLFGQEFDDAFTAKRKSKKTGIEVEYDIILINCQSACIVEVKYKADTDDVIKTLKKEKTFRINFPEYADKKLYLALASMSFDKYVENECIKYGIAIIKQKGDTIEVYDEHLKMF